MVYFDRAFHQEMGTPNEAQKRLPHIGQYEKKRVKLALQGGGAYGAYTTGVVIQMLLDPKIEIVEIAGTSAGEKIALIVADRINSAATYDEGRQAAIHALFDFWGQLVRESAPMMNALDVVGEPWSPERWTRFFASATAAHNKAHLPNWFEFWRRALPGNMAVQFTMNAMEGPVKAAESQMVFGIDGKRRASANLPALEDMTAHHQRLADVFEASTRAAPWFGAVPRGFDMALGSLRQASTAVATAALRNIIGKVLTSEPHPTDPDDRIFTHAASGKFIKVHINTAKELRDGTLVNCVHTGRDLTLKRSMGSSALMGFFEPPVIDGYKHWDGGYTENTCLTALADSKIPADAVMIVGTNRPIDHTITPRLQRDIPRRELDITKGLIWHQMYAEAVHHAENWKQGQPTWHMVTYNHAPENDWTAKQNTFDWHIRSLLHRGQSDGVSELIAIRPYIGVKPTIDRAGLEDVARESKIAGHLQNRKRNVAPRGGLHAA